MSESICEILLRDRQGAVVARARVDEDDWFAFARYRWWMQDGYAIGYLGVNPGTFLHRAVLGLANGDPRQPDHINRDRLDCRKANLRIITQAQNNQNLTPRKGGTSRYRGVSFHPASGLWHVRVKVDGRTISGGYFRDEDEAGHAAVEMRRVHMPYSEEAAA